MQFNRQRRAFITLLGGAVGWPLAAGAQQAERVRRIGWLFGRAESDPESQASRAAFQEALVKLGWIEGRNLRIDLRFAADDPYRIRAYAMELVALARGGGDPVAIGLVRNIAQPEGNSTGFSGPEPSIAGKYLGLLKEAAPRNLLFFDRGVSASIGHSGNQDAVPQCH